MNVYYKNSHNQGSKEGYKQSGPPFIIYSEPKQPYNHFVNRFCQSKSKMMNCYSKDEAIKLANSFWDQKKKNQEFIEQYIASPPSLLFPKPKGTQKTLNSFFVNLANTCDNKGLEAQISLYQPQEERKNEEIPKNKRHYEEISGEREESHLKKNKSSSQLWKTIYKENLATIKNLKALMF